MKLDLKKYTTPNILIAYTFLYQQWLGATMINDIDEDDMELPTVYIIKQALLELRDVYIKRKDSALHIIVKIEKEVFNQVSELVNTSDEEIRQIMERKQGEAFLEIEALKKKRNSEKQS